MGNPNIPRLDPGGTRFGTASTGGPTPGHKCLGRFKVCGSGVGSGLLRMIEDYFPIPTFFKVGIQPLGGSCWITWRARISFRSLFLKRTLCHSDSQVMPGPSCWVSKVNAEERWRWSQSAGTRGPVMDPPGSIHNSWLLLVSKAESCMVDGCFKANQNTNHQKPVEWN